MDLLRPVKLALREAGNFAFDSAEHDIMTCVWRRFGLEPPSEANGIGAEVDAADEMLLVTEARDLMSPLTEGWHHRPENGYAVLPYEIVPWQPRTARREFLLRFRELGERTDG